MDRDTLEFLFGPWYHMPVGVGLAAGLFWLFRRKQPGVHSLVVVSRAALVAAIVLLVTLPYWLGPVSVYLAVVSLVCGIIALSLRGLKVGIWGLLVPAIAMAQLCFTYLLIKVMLEIQ